MYSGRLEYIFSFIITRITFFPYRRAEKLAQGGGCPGPTFSSPYKQGLSRASTKHHSISAYSTCGLIFTSLENDQSLEFFLFRDPQFFSTNANIGVASGGWRPVPGPPRQPRWPPAPRSLGGPSITINKLGIYASHQYKLRFLLEESKNSPNMSMSHQWRTLHKALVLCQFFSLDSFQCHDSIYTLKFKKREVSLKS